MTPLQLWIDGLENRYWSIRGRLRGHVDDPQICGHGYCALGVLCDLFLKHAPEEAATAKARWDDYDFVWVEDGVESRQSKQNNVPAPVLAWWRRFHPIELGGVIQLNDQEYRSFRELSMYLRGAAAMPYLTTK